MNGDDFVNALMRRLKIDSRVELAKVLGKNPVVLSSWKNHDLSPVTIAGIIAGLVERQVTADRLSPLLKARLGIETDVELVELLGMSRPQLHNWKQRSNGLTARQICNAIEKAANVAATKARHNVIRPVVEFARIDRSPAGQKFNMFPTRGEAGRYYVGLRAALEDKQGVYVFYDSRGHALYVGKTSEQGLWKEMNNAFNRTREAQSIKMVRHPKSSTRFRSSDEKHRQIQDTNLKLSDLAEYFSAFEVSPGMISELEALLVRAFPNDLLNRKTERFQAVRAKRAVAAAKRLRRRTA